MAALSQVFSLYQHVDAALTERAIDHALIGGFALAAHQVVRATEDVDFLIAAERESEVHAWMGAQGFETLLRTENVSNYLRPDGARVDFVHARRAYTRQMLAEALDLATAGARVRVVRAEDLIGLKVQASSNDPRRRLGDMADIRHLLESRAGQLDMVRIRTYFRIFNREVELDEILELVTPSSR